MPCWASQEKYLDIRFVHVKSFGSHMLDISKFVRLTSFHSWITKELSLEQPGFIQLPVDRLNNIES